MAFVPQFENELQTQRHSRCFRPKSLLSLTMDAARHTTHRLDGPVLILIRILMCLVSRSVWPLTAVFKIYVQKPRGNQYIN